MKQTLVKAGPFLLLVMLAVAVSKDKFSIFLSRGNDRTDITKITTMATTAAPSELAENQTKVITAYVAGSERIETCMTEIQTSLNNIISAECTTMSTTAPQTMMSTTTTTANSQNQISYYKIEPGDCKSILPEKLGFSMEIIEKYNPNYDWSCLIPGDILMLPIDMTKSNVQAKSSKFYTVSDGDCLFGLASSLRCTPETLMELNPNYDWNMLIGDIIVIPESTNMQEETMYEEYFPEDKVNSGEAEIAGQSVVNTYPDWNSWYNIELACQYLNGMIIEPGENFDWEQKMGDNGKDLGYIDAPVIVGQDTVDGPGGGVCVVSTAVYQAFRDCGIPDDYIIHYPHSKMVTYATPEDSASVSYGSKNLVVPNTTGYRLYCKTESDYGYVKITFYIV